MKITNDVLLKLDSPRAWRTYTGGANLDLLHQVQFPTISQFPEEWIMSVVEARNVGREHIQEGLSHLLEYNNLSLKDLIAQNPSYYLGETHSRVWNSQLGVLVKLIDSAERLTIQVHPNKELARSLFHSDFGKTECWHILDTTSIDGDSACIYMGFKPGITRELWKSYFDSQDISGMLSCMHRINVFPGDTILIEGGIPHAIGAGCFLVEIQEPTDYTIRVEKTTPAGLTIADSMCHQGLGFETMFDCFIYEGFSEEETKKRWFIPRKLKFSNDSGSIHALIDYQTCSLFSLEDISITDSFQLDFPDTFCGLYILGGEGIVSSNELSRSVKKAEQYFVPANTKKLTVTSLGKSPLRILRFQGPKVL